MPRQSNNLPRRGHSIHVHSNYMMNRFNNGNQNQNQMQNPSQNQYQSQNQNQNQNQTQNTANDQIYIESGSSESNYSAVDALSNGVHKQNLLPGMGQSNNSHINRRAFRNRYNRGNGLRGGSARIS